MNWFIVHSSTFIVTKSHLGCFDVVSNANANVAETFSFDVWGYRRKHTDWTAYDDSRTFLFNRGYTGHEHYDLFRVINMNGRLYDPVLGRFFSPDPFVGDPTGTQNFNRYSYVRNNPLMYTDPTGYQYSFSWSWSSTGQLCIQFPTVEIVAYRRWWENPIWGYGYFAPVYGGPYYESYEDYLYWQNNIAGGGGGNGGGRTSATNNSKPTTESNIVNDVAVGTVNTILFAVGIPQIIGGNIASAFNNGEYPRNFLTIPWQIDNTWSFYRQDNSMGFGATDNISNSDFENIGINTVGSALFFFPFSQSSSWTVRNAQNFLIGTAITTSMSEGRKSNWLHPAFLQNSNNNKYERRCENKIHKK